MTREFWTYVIDGAINDSEYETKEEAQQEADKDFYYECIGDDLLFGFERGVTYVKCRINDFGDKIILKSERSKQAFNRDDYINQDCHPDFNRMGVFI